jgi:predicted NUDIX family NTP pyrophosphohydrolase
VAARKQSAGLLMYRRGEGGPEVFLVHPGGPFFARKDAGYWSVPKGEIDDPAEPPLAVARREFAEETGQTVEDCATGGDLLPLGSVQQANGKVVQAWAFAGDWPPGATFASNTFELEWPPRSGRRQPFPEVDRGEFFPLPAAREKINPAQQPFLDRLVAALEVG